MDSYKPSRKQLVLGMTTAQLLILAALAAIIFCVVGVGAWLVFTLPAPTPEAAMAVPTLFIPPPATAASRSAETSLLTLTPLPTSTPIPGWKKFEGGGVELGLPENFDGGDATQNPEALFEKFVSAGADRDKNADFKQDLLDKKFAVFAYDTVIADSSYYFTTVRVFSDTTSAGIALDPYIDNAISNLEIEYRVVGRESFLMDYFSGIRIIMEGHVTLENQTTVYRKTSLYVVKVKDTFWIVQYVTDRAQFKDYSPVFDLSAKTFVVKTD